MPKVTDIETQKKNAKRKSVYVDGEFVAGVHEDVVAQTGIFVGQEIDYAFINSVLLKEQERYVREKALRLVDYRDRTKGELEKRLVRDGCDQKTTEKVVADLERAGIIDDKKFAREFLESRNRSKPLGKMRMAREMYTRGVEKDLAEEVLENYTEEEEYENALSLARKKTKNMAGLDKESLRKIAGFLARRGFDWETISKVMDEIGAEMRSYED